MSEPAVGPPSDTPPTRCPNCGTLMLAGWQPCCATEPPSDAAAIALAFIVDTARMVIADLDTNLDPTESLNLLRRTVHQHLRATRDDPRQP